VRLITNGEFGKDVEAVRAYFNVLSWFLEGQWENKKIFAPCSLVDIFLPTTCY
jgi:hypothetical protein